MSSDLNVNVQIVDCRAIQNAWADVFETNDPFLWPFVGGLAPGRLFFPTEGHHLSRDQYEALMGAMKQVGESRYFVSLVESDGLSFLERSWGHWECTDLSYDDYLRLDLPVESALYSQSGTWGCLLSYEDHAIVSGSAEFMVALDAAYTCWEQGRKELLAFWGGNEKSGWLSGVLKELHRGEAKGKTSE